MILYIHGFASSGLGSKAQVFRRYFAEQGISFFAPSLPTIPALAIQTLEEYIESKPAQQIGLIGSSLGGFYALYLANKYKLKAVLINPAMTPYRLLNNFDSHVKHFHDGSEFEFNKDHAAFLESFHIKQPDISSLLVMLQTGDDVLDYQVALTQLKGAAMVVEEGGTHSFEAIERHFERIQAFLTEPLSK